MIRQPQYRNIKKGPGGRPGSPVWPDRPGMDERFERPGIRRRRRVREWKWQSYIR